MGTAGMSGGLPAATVDDLLISWPAVLASRAATGVYGRA